jgi:acyl-CoA dehydrogenase
MDLVGRKMMDGGDMAYRILEEVQADAEAARPAMPDLAGDLWSAAETLRETTEWIVAQDMDTRFAGAAPYLRAFARVLGAHAHLRAAVAEGRAGSRSALARVYIRRLLPMYAAHLAEAREGGAAVMALSPDDLAA